MFDFHIHSKNSHDSKQTLDEICNAAIEKGLSGIAVCDHVDMWFCKELGTYEQMQICISEVKQAKTKYQDKLKVFQGIELAEYLYDTDLADKILRLCDYDVILGSVHCVVYDDLRESYSCLDFGESVKEEKIIGFLNRYFEEVIRMINAVDVDVLTHLTCPLRYINGKYHRNIDAMLFKDIISEIYSRIIEKGVALEVNTSGINTSLGSFMPNAELLKLYFSMGGRLITIGSDAHIPGNIGNGFEKARDVLKDIGFNKYCYYDKRNRIDAVL